MTPFEYFLRGYINALLWSTTVQGHDGEDHTADQFQASRELNDKARVDCQAFFDANKADIEDAAGLYKITTGDAGDTGFDYAGHDFALTRNGHGAGFWDGDLPKHMGDRLTVAAKVFGECYLSLSDTNLLYPG